MTPRAPRPDPPEFDAMAKWYDFDYERRHRRDLPFWSAIAREGGSPVLELGAGTGRVTSRLARDGHDVTAVEVSPAMLARARARFARRPPRPGSVELLAGDMAELSVRGRFGTVVVPFRAFNHLYTAERQLAALRAIRRRLAPEGLAALDLWNPDLSELAASGDRVQVAYDRKHPRGTRVVQRFRVRHDVASQMAWLDYWWDEYRGRRRIGRDHAPMHWRWIHRFELEHLLARAGLRVARLHGDFRGGPFRAGAEELVVVATRD